MRSHSFITSLLLLAPATTFAASLAERDLTPVAGYAGFTYSGCYTDTPSARTLNGPSYCDDDGMTGQKCIEFCNNKGFHLAGVEFGQECFCGNFPASGATLKSGECTMACHGDSTQPCGAPDRIDIYTSPVAAASENPGSKGYKSLGCYTDRANARGLSQRGSVDGPMTVEKCIAACDARGLSIAGVEFGSECFCGSTFDNGACPAPGATPADNGCNMACAGDSTSLCGGPDRLNVYFKDQTVTLAGFSGPQCYTDSRSSRSLGIATPVDGGFDAMTPEKCVAACTTAGYGLAGVEYGRECYCASIGDNHGTPADTKNCNKLCTGNHNELCGGEDFISVYTNLAGDPSKPVTQPKNTCDITPADLKQCATGNYCGTQYSCYCSGMLDGSSECLPVINFGGGYCGQVGVFDQCSKNTDCTTGKVCVTNTCCGYGVCVKTENQGTCPNNTTPKRLFRIRGITAPVIARQDESGAPNALLPPTPSS